jgi:hypothetical protein
MANKQEVATYVSALIEELVQMCREAGLSDLEFLLSLTAAEAAKLRSTAAATDTVAQSASTH